MVANKSIKDKRKKVAIVGCNGIPAQYGGFETLADHLTEHLNDEFDFTVYCSKNQKTRPTSYNGSRLIYLPLSANGAQAYIYDFISFVHAMFYADTILYLGSAFFVPFFRIFGKKIIVNHGGLNEWERSKYSKIQRFLSKLSHNLSAKYAQVSITDNELLRANINSCFGADSLIIRYGGDHAIKEPITDDLLKKFAYLDKKYYVSVSRAQVDNNLHLLLKAFEMLPDHNLVLVSNWNSSSYGSDLKKQYYGKFPNIIIQDAIYDIKELNAVRGNALAYIHTHSFCGTAPSLVEAICLGLPIISLDMPTNRETTHGNAIFFKDEIELANAISSLTDEKLDMLHNESKTLGENSYTWRIISKQYADIF